VQTRVGYAGAATPDPVYRNLGGHAEVLRVIFDPASLCFSELLAESFDSHEPRRSLGQYRSVLFPADAGQVAEVERVLELRPNGSVPEVVAPGTPEARFWDAEDYHQKYRLRRNAGLVDLLETELGADWDRHALATKLNASGSAGLDLKPWLAQLSPGAQRAFRLG
jgi:peptide-methionine (S)-S-oxide reductase